MTRPAGYFRAVHCMNLRILRGDGARLSTLASTNRCLLSVKAKATVTSHVHGVLTSLYVPASVERSGPSEFLVLQRDELHRTPRSRQVMAFEDTFRPEHDIQDLQ